ncbi:MAG: hypothetical protein ACXADF_15980, partial [Candidatus Thorarchaeota archaeon]
MSDDSGKGSQMSILLTLVIIMLLAPMGLIFYIFDRGPFWYVNIVAMSWMANYEAYDIYFRPDPMMILATLPFSFMRIGFVYMVWRAYEGKTSTSRVLKIGIAMELWFSLLFYLPNLIS